LEMNCGSTYALVLQLVIIALMTMSFQSVKAALTNPVNSLKHE
jgi:hypothetical protein